MKKLLTIFCCILLGYAILFPFSYFGKTMDKKEVRISHILVESLDEAKKIKQEIENGSSFAEAAEKYSIDDSSKHHKGDLGFTQRGIIFKNLEDAAFKLEKGKVSEPMETPEGWHILKVMEINYYSDDKNFKYDPYKYLDL